MPKKLLPALLSSLILLSSLAALAPTPSLAQTNPLCVAGQALDFFDSPALCDSFAGYLDKYFTQQPNNPWYAPTPQEFGQKVLDPSNPNEIFGERYTYAQVRWIINSLITLMNPIAGSQNPAEVIQFFKTMVDLLTYDSINKPAYADYAKLGPLGIIGGSIEYLYTHPVASGAKEVENLVQKTAGLVPPVHAQGVGYTKLGQGNVLLLWTATRNMAYLITILLLIASGFMVMFRTKINPQTIISVQMIIPKLAIALVLITFSYAIVGFVIDMIYVVITAFIGLLSVASPTLFSPGGVVTAISTLTGDFRFVATFLLWPILIAIILLAALIIVPVVVGFYPGTVGIAIIPLLGLLFGIFAWAIYVWVRVVGQLMLAYLNIVLLTIVGPLQIMMDVLPLQKNIGFWPWLKCVIGNASVFVSYALLAIVARALFNFGSVSGTTLGFDLGVTRLQTGFTLPLADFSNIQSFFVWAFLAIGYFTAVPNIVAGVRDAFCKSEDYSKFLENFVKDTVGQVSKAGQSAGEGIGKFRAQQQAALTPTGTTSGAVGSTSGGGTTP